MNFYSPLTPFRPCATRAARSGKTWWTGPEDHPESLAFSLLMIRLDGCLSCETDSFRAMRGCVACAQQVLHRYKGPDADLLKRYGRCLHEVRSHLGVPEESDLAARAA
jgi:hypothetical protein